jgi:hypothetical protein
LKKSDGSDSSEFEMALQETSFFAAEFKNEPSKELSHQDVQLEDIMKVSFLQKKTKKVNDSLQSIKFGDCSAVAGVLSEPSLLDELG